MRTTIDLPEREHALLTGLARERGTSFSKLVLELAMRGLKNPTVAAAQAGCETDPETGFAVFRSGRPITGEDIKDMEEEELERHGSPS